MPAFKTATSGCVSQVAITPSDTTIYDPPLKALWIAKLDTTLPVALAGAFLVGVVTGALAFSRWKSQREKAKSAG